MSTGAQAFVQRSIESDPAAQEIIAVSKQLEQSLMRDGYQSTLWLLSRFAENRRPSGTEYLTWHYRVTRAIANMDVAGLSRVVNKHLVRLATEYDYPGMSDQMRRDLLTAGMPQGWMDALPLVPTSEAVRAAARITGMGFTNYLLSLVAKLDTTVGMRAQTNSRASGGSQIVLVSTRTTVDGFDCLLAILAAIAVALGVASCAAAVSGIALASCIGSILSIPGAAISILVECFE